MSMHHIGRGYRSVGCCPDCGTEFRLVGAGPWYATCGLATLATILLEWAIADMLPVATRSAVAVLYFAVVLVVATFLTWLFPYAVRLERVPDGRLKSSGR